MHAHTPAGHAANHFGLTRSLLPRAAHPGADSSPADSPRDAEVEHGNGSDPAISSTPEEAYRIDANGQGWTEAEKREHFWVIMHLFGFPALGVVAMAVAVLILHLNPDLQRALSAMLGAAN